NTYWMYSICEYTINICLLLDILFHFRTAIYKERGEIVTDIRIISISYLKSYFIPDLISIIPLDVFTNADFTDKTYFYLFIIKIPRFIRIIKIKKYFATKRFGIIFKLVMLFCIYFLIAHYFACILSFIESI